jgi:hypothetical protein
MRTRIAVLLMTVMMVVMAAPPALAHHGEDTHRPHPAQPVEPPGFEQGQQQPHVDEPDTGGGNRIEHSNCQGKYC